MDRIFTKCCKKKENDSIQGYVYERSSGREQRDTLQPNTASQKNARREVNNLRHNNTDNKHICCIQKQRTHSDLVLSSVKLLKLLSSYKMTAGRQATEAANQRAS